jgi:hypothetical protein
MQCTGDSIHGLNQRREASQVSRTPPRKRHEERGHFFLEATTKAKLLRLAHHRNCSVPALIGDLTASGERRDGTTVREGPEAVLRRGIAATTRVSDAASRRVSDKEHSAIDQTKALKRSSPAASRLSNSIT